MQTSRIPLLDGAGDGAGEGELPGPSEEEGVVTPREDGGVSVSVPKLKRGDAEESTDIPEDVMVVVVSNKSVLPHTEQLQSSDVKSDISPLFLCCSFSNDVDGSAATRFSAASRRCLALRLRHPNTSEVRHCEWMRRYTRRCLRLLRAAAAAIFFDFLVVLVAVLLCPMMANGSNGDDRPLQR